MIASLNICAAVHGTVDDNMAVHEAVDKNNGEEDGRLDRTAPIADCWWTPAVVVLASPCWRHETVMLLARSVRFCCDEYGPACVTRDW